jgi:hypothetical protein
VLGRSENVSFSCSHHHLDPAFDEKLEAVDFGEPVYTVEMVVGIGA